MIGTYTIALARPEDLPFLTEIELVAARLLEGFAPESVLREATPSEEFERAMDRGHLWVAHGANRPVGFAHVKLVEPHSAHLDELDVHPEHGRKGLGRQLVTEVCAWAAQKGLEAVTLSTFREPRWNMPFYASLGFEVIPKSEWSPAITRVVVDEIIRGLNPRRRVVMRRRLRIGST